MEYHLYNDEEWLKRKYIILGKTGKEIAKICKTHSQVIYNKLRKFGIFKLPRKNQNKLEIKKYKCRGYLFCLYILCKMSTVEIGRECEVNRITICRWLKIHNIKREKPLYTNKQWLYNHYIILKKSSNQIAKEFYNITDSSTILNWLRKFKIPIRSISKSHKISHNKLEYIAKRSGKNNHMWKEWENLSYEQKHRRKRNELKEMDIFEPENCPDCSKKPRIKKYIHLMNLDHKYLDNTLDYYYMCIWCHKIYDFLAGLRKHKTIKPIPNLIKNLLQLKTREEREQLLKKVIR
ncbi:hypothetical protein LCGC14_2292090 [marine sediment metagenome]|uniref:Uncharacterized protein n=1 Tax=marine sediment metagenome TaxID=412755 RepID=A0A0F9CQZ6_9ZZZZ